MQDCFYVMWSEIGNQCSALRNGLVCSYKEDLRIVIVGWGITTQCPPA